MNGGHTTEQKRMERGRKRALFSSKWREENDGELSTRAPPRFVCYLVFVIPLHAARKGYGSGSPLPLRTSPAKVGLYIGHATDCASGACRVYSRQGPRSPLVLCPLYTAVPRGWGETRKSDMTRSRMCSRPTRDPGHPQMAWVRG